jgi:hypothetical protein
MVLAGVGEGAASGRSWPMALGEERYLDPIKSARHRNRMDLFAMADDVLARVHGQLRRPVDLEEMKIGMEP